MIGRFPRRSLLYSPGDQPTLLEKAFETDADALIFDFEDSVAPANKSTARENVVALAEAIETASKEVAVRINDLRTDVWPADIRAAAEAGVDAIRLPAVESAWEVRTAVETIDRHAPEPAIEVGVGLETPRGLYNGRAIARTIERSPAVTYLSYGNADYTTAIGAPAPTEAILDQLRFAAASYAAIAGVEPVATAHLDVRDSDGLRKAAERNRAFGFIGMSAIHPEQVSVINEVFTPDEARVERARRMVEAFEASEQDSIMVEDVFLDAPVVERYRKLIRRSEAIAAFEDED